MIEIFGMTTERAAEYSKFAKADEFENCKRALYEGLMAYEDSKAAGALLFKKTSDENGSVSEEIVFFDAESDSLCDAILEVFFSKKKDEGVLHVFFELKELSDHARKALEKAGFTISEKNGKDIVVSVDELKNLKLPNLDKNSSVYALSEASDSSFWNAITLSLYNQKPRILEDLENLPRDWFEPEVSCFIKSDKWIEGLFLVHALPSGMLMPCLLFSTGKGSDKNLLSMIRFASSKAGEKYDKDTKILLRKSNDDTAKLIGYFFPDKMGEKVMFGEKKA